MSDETNFKRAIRRLLGSWSTTVEHGRGGSAGICDLLILEKQLLFPVEIKIGEWKGNRLFCSRIRPDQIRFLDQLTSAGGKAAVVVGINKGLRNWDAWLIKDCRTESLLKWSKVGWGHTDVELLVKATTMLMSVEQMVRSSNSFKTDMTK